MASFKYKNVYLKDYYTVAGPLERDGKLKYNLTADDYYFECETLEEAERKMQKVVLDNLISKSKITENNIDILVGGDLLNQDCTTSYNARDYNIPFLGVYSACATFQSAMIIISNFIEGKFIKNGVAITSSHNLNCEKQFRAPIEYGSPKPDKTTFTATGSAGVILTNEADKVKVESATIGRVVDYGIDDVFHMGAIMAPAAADVLVKHLKDLKRDVNYYDLIITGDLGKIGEEILKEFVLKNHNIKLKKYFDAGTKIYDYEKQPVFSGASGTVSLPFVLFNYVLKRKRYKKILMIGTGSLHTPLMMNQKNSIPATAHAVSLEVVS